jgi:hypothetical protein
MPRVSEFLDRFRPAGAPGAASGAGVPSDRRAGMEAELEPVFAALDEVQRECARLRETAAERAGRRREEAAGQARVIVARARAGAQAARAEAAADARRQAADEIAAIAVSAERAADAVRRSARQRRPELVARVVEMVRAELAEVTPTDEPVSAEPAGAVGR